MLKNKLNINILLTKENGDNIKKDDCLCNEHLIKYFN